MTGDFDLGLFFCVEGGATMKKRWGGNRGLEERMGRERSELVCEHPQPHMTYFNRL